jgi:hypothetical protein
MRREPVRIPRPVPIKPKHKPALRIFLSHTWKDRAYADKVRNVLSHIPEVHIFTSDMLSAGEDWQSELKDELSRCDIFFLILSPTAIDSKWMLYELGATWALDKPIVVVLTHPKMPWKMPVDISPKKILVVEIEKLVKPEIINKILGNFVEMAAAPTTG